MTSHEQPVLARSGHSRSLQSRSGDRDSVRSISLKFHLLTTFLLTMLVLSMRLTLKPWYQQDGANVAREAALAQAKDIEAYWKTFQFKESLKGNLAEAFVQRIDWQKVPLSELKRRTIESRLKLMIGYLQNPSADAYYELRTRGLIFDLIPNDQLRREMSNSPTLKMAAG